VAKINDWLKLWKKLKSPIGDFNCLRKNHRLVKLPCNPKITGFLNYATYATQGRVACVAYFA